MSRRHKGRYHSQGVPAGNDDQPAGQDELTGFVRPGMADVIARREEEFIADTGITPEDPENIIEKFVAPAAPGEVDGDTEDASPPDASTKAPVEDKPKEPDVVPPPTDADEIELVVDGEKVKKTRAELIEIGRRAAQKELASDKRLEEAARIKREAEELRSQAQAETRRTPQEPAAPATPPATDIDFDKALDEKRKALIQAQAYGDTEEQEAAHREYEQAVFAKANAGRQPATPPLDTRAVADQVKADMAKEKIVERFVAPVENEGFKDIWDDMELRSQVLQEVNKSIAAGADGLKWETYAAAGKKVRAYREFLKTYESGDTPAPTETPVPVVHRTPTVDPTLSERAARKRQIPSVPTASASATTPEEKPQDTSQVISELARRRPGQQ